MTLEPPKRLLVPSLLLDLRRTPASAAPKQCSQLCSRMLSLEAAVPRLRKRCPSMQPGVLLPRLLDDAAAARAPADAHEAAEGSKGGTADRADHRTNPEWCAGTFAAALVSTAALRGHGAVVAQWVLAPSTATSSSQAGRSELFAAALARIGEPAVHEKVWQSLLHAGGCSAERFTTPLDTLSSLWHEGTARALPPAQHGVFVADLALRGQGRLTPAAQDLLVQVCSLYTACTASLSSSERVVGRGPGHGSVAVAADAGRYKVVAVPRSLDAQSGLTGMPQLCRSSASLRRDGEGLSALHEQSSWLKPACRQPTCPNMSVHAAASAATRCSTSPMPRSRSGAASAQCAAVVPRRWQVVHTSSFCFWQRRTGKLSSGAPRRYRACSRCGRPRVLEPDGGLHHIISVAASRAPQCQRRHRDRPIGGRLQGVSRRIGAGATNEAASRQGKRVARLFSHFAVVAAARRTAEASNHARASGLGEPESTPGGAADEVDAIGAAGGDDMEVWRPDATTLQRARGTWRFPFRLPVLVRCPCRAPCTLRSVCVYACRHLAQR